MIEDFEGCTDGDSDLKANGLFTFGSVKAAIDTKLSARETYSGKRYVIITKEGNLSYAGWGKGIGLNVELDVSKDNLNFYLFQPSSNTAGTLKIELQEDDDGDNVFKKDRDDSWEFQQKTEPKNTWELFSIPLNKFKDGNPGGDGIFNISYKQGKLLAFVVTFTDAATLKNNQSWAFDEICFSQGKLPTGNTIMSAPLPSAGDFCSLGAWSKESNTEFEQIPLNFEKNFSFSKKLGVAHFFQPFAVDGGNTQNNYPSVERINKVISENYIPMITLEDHFVNSNPNMKQPNLYSITEGHFDAFFADWAKQIKQVKGTVLLRILHEFNGDWYPWCIANNDRNPQLLISAYRRIHDIFKAQQVTNVKFIWCPNSMSLPQESWNFIMDAYPGDEYVDFVALDIYNGAGKEFSVWRSFRKEGIENYFILTQRLPSKPLLICESASRERTSSESGSGQNKAEWIQQTAEALSSDMSKVRLLAWFNEKGTFKVNSSQEALSAYQNYIFKNGYFKSGKDDLEKIVK